MSTQTFKLERNAAGRLVCTLSDGTSHVNVTPVRSFPLARARRRSGPDEPGRP